MFRKLIRIIINSMLPEEEGEFRTRINVKIAQINMKRIVAASLFIFIIQLVFIVKDLFYYEYSFPRWQLWLPQGNILLICVLYLFVALYFHNNPQTPIYRLYLFTRLYCVLLLTSLIITLLMISVDTSTDVSPLIFCLLMAFLPLTDFYESVLYSLLLLSYWVSLILLGVLNAVDALTSAMAVTGFFILLCHIIYQSMRGQLLGQFRLEQLNEEIDQISMTDTLTRLLNRRGLQNTIDTLFLHNKNATLALVMLDVDYFKDYNDMHGHLMGDECLKKIAGVIRSCMKGTQSAAARIGGEEFLIVFKNAEYQQIQLLIRQMQEQIHALKLEAGNKQAREIVTVSVGFLPPGVCGIKQWDEALEFADKALYQAKKSGRDCVYEAEPLLG